MPQTYEGSPRADSRDAFAIVVARYNDTITRRLLDGACGTLQAAGVDERQIEVAWVPGAWELPLVAQALASSGRFAAVLCLGAVIRGETSHDQYINQQVSDSLGRLALEMGVPVLFGVLTCYTLEQALNRAGGTSGNKGEECADAALRMVDLLRQLRAGQQSGRGKVGYASRGDA